MRYFILLFTLIGSGLGLLNGCSQTKPQAKTAAELLFKEAKRLKEDGSLILATEKLSLLRSKYPYSFYATQAELMLADIQFEQEDFINAAASYIRFRDFHPKSERIAYVIFRIGESFYQQLPDTFDRDLSAAGDAIKYFKELIQRYPGSKYKKEAQEHIQKAQQKIERKERYIADFYFKTEVWQAARYRYLSILKSFSGQSLREHAMQRVVISSLRMEEPSECLRFAERFLPKLSLKRQSAIKKTVSKCLEMRDNQLKD